MIFYYTFEETSFFNVYNRFTGAEIFAKRRKRSEKWVVDKDQPQIPSTPGMPKMYPGKPVRFILLQTT